MYTRREMLELVVVDGVARGIVTRDMVTGEIECHAADAVVLATGGYGNVFYLSTNAKGCNATAIWRAYKKGAAFANPCYTQIHPTCIPVTGEHQSKLTLMSESLRNDGRIWVPAEEGRQAARRPDPGRASATITWSASTPPSATWPPGTSPPAPPSSAATRAAAWARPASGVYLDFADAIKRLGQHKIEERYGNLFEMYERITDENPYKVPMRIYPASHYTMGGLWVDYNLMSTVPGLFVLGEANFSDHGANRLGASALMQGLADGYFVIPYTIAGVPGERQARHPDQAGRPGGQGVAAGCRGPPEQACSPSRASRPPPSSTASWARSCGSSAAWPATRPGSRKRSSRSPSCARSSGHDLCLPGSGTELNQTLEQAGRVADFLEFGELMCLDALERRESCGGHFREEWQTEDGEAKRDDENFCHVAAWEYKGDGEQPQAAQGTATFDNVHLADRSYK